MLREGQSGTYFSLWAPNAKNVTIRGDFNSYDIHSHPMRLRDDGSGIWEVFIEGVDQGTTYKYHISTGSENTNPDKADPYAFYAEVAPNSASKIWDIEGYKWNDTEWMSTRAKKEFAQGTYIDL